MSKPTTPIIPSVDVTEYTENDLPALSFGTDDISVYAERLFPGDPEPVGFSVGEFGGIEWLTSPNARTLGMMLIAAADWNDAQGADDAQPDPR